MARSTRAEQGQATICADGSYDMMTMASALRAHAPLESKEPEIILRDHQTLVEGAEPQSEDHASLDGSRADTAWISRFWPPRRASSLQNSSLHLISSSLNMWRKPLSNHILPLVFNSSTFSCCFANSVWASVTRSAASCSLLLFALIGHCLYLSLDSSWSDAACSNSC